MDDLRQHEQLELEVIKTLSDQRLLEPLIFGGGTCLRLCFGINRYSVDLDFWLRTRTPAKQGSTLGVRTPAKQGSTLGVPAKQGSTLGVPAKQPMGGTDLYFKQLVAALSAQYTLTDTQAKYFSLLVELKSPSYPRRLKIEIRKQLPENFETELNIAFSPFSTHQVRLTSFTLKQLWRNKVHAFLDRRAIRDAYDLEFIYKKGEADFDGLLEEERKSLIEGLKRFKPRDFKVNLGMLLEPEDRRYYSENGFKLLERGLTGARG